MSNTELVSTDLTEITRAEVEANKALAKQTLHSMRLGPTGFRPNSFAEAMELGKVFHASGMFKDLQSAAQATVKIIVGSEWGFTPAQSINGIHIIEGKFQLGYTQLGSLVKRAEGYDYKVLEITDKKARVEFFRADLSLGISEFTMEDAQKAGTKNTGKFPRNMLIARAISNGIKWFCPEILNGISVYTEGEISEEELEQVMPASAIKGLSARLEQRQDDTPIINPLVDETEGATPPKNGAPIPYLIKLGWTEDQRRDFESKCQEVGADPVEVQEACQAKGLTEAQDIYDFVANWGSSVESGLFK